MRSSYLFEEPKTENANEEENAGYSFWLDFDKVIILDENTRHKRDKDFGCIMTRLRTGILDGNDKKG